MSLPADLRTSVDAALATRPDAPRVVAADLVGGGCINHGVRLTLSSGGFAFLKWNPRSPPGMFEAEIQGLRALAAPGIARIPEPWSHGSSPSGAWLLMEYVPRGSSTDRASGSPDLLLARHLAVLHATHPGEGGLPWGWSHDNWIGSVPQANPPRRTWGTFWADERLEPRYRAAHAAGHFHDAGGRDIEEVIARTEGILADVGPAESGVIHGDLWGGNAYVGHGGRPVLIDPAVYRGHGEVDLAMTELFGGFGPGFYRAYHDLRIVPPAYESHRRALYQLYYLLVHVNLFGSSYVQGCVEAARTVLAAWG